jgi:hypothetical protein
LEENRLKLEKFDQIGILVKDIENVANYLGNLLQFKSDLNIIEQVSTVFYKEKEVTFKMKKVMQNFAGKQFEVIEIVESSGDHLYLDFINRNKEGLHHLGIYNKIAEDLIEYFKNKYNIEVIQSGKAGKVKFYFLDTWKLIGFYLELISF